MENDRVGGARNDDRQPDKGTASPDSGSRRRNAKTAVEMTSLRKPQNGSHRDVEISLENARFPHSHSGSSSFTEDEKRRTRQTTAATRRHMNRPQASRILGHIQDRQE